MNEEYRGGVVIEGSLTAAFDDDSSDDERDNHEHSVPVASDHAGADSNIEMNDDGEELEVFSNERAISTGKNRGSIQSHDQVESSLVSAMMLSVTQVEKFGDDIQKSPRTSAPDKAVKAADPFTTKRSKTTSLEESNAPEAADMFGIAYKPFMKKKDDYTMPKGAAFEDEAEFEQDMNFSKARKIDEEDDEFDIDVHDDYIPPNKISNEKGNYIPSDLAEIKSTSTASEMAEKRAIENAAREKEEEILFMAALRDENRLQLAEKEKLKSKSNGENLFNQGKKDFSSDDNELSSNSASNAKPSIRIAAKKSLDEIVGVYSNGLGDQEVLMLDVANDTCYTPKGGHLILKGVTTIDEGDEEEDERQELEEVSALAENVLQKMKLAAEWDDINNNNDNNGDKNRDDFCNTNNGTQNYDDFMEDKFQKVTYDEALNYLRGTDLNMYKNSIIVKDEPGSSWSILNGPRQLKFENHEEKLNFPFLLAQYNYEPSEQKLIDIMRTIFKMLTTLNDNVSTECPEKESSSCLFCPRVGPHWEQIGFQGLDPRTVKEHQTSTGGNGNKDDQKNTLNNNDDCYYNNDNNLMNPDDIYDSDIDNYDHYDSVSIQGFVEEASSPQVRRKVSISSDISAASDISSLVSVAKSVSIATKNGKKVPSTNTNKNTNASLNVSRDNYSNINKNDKSINNNSSSSNNNSYDDQSLDLSRPTGSRKLLLRNKQSILDSVPSLKSSPKPSPAPSPRFKTSQPVQNNRTNNNNSNSNNNGYNNENELGMFKIQHHTYSKPTKSNTKYSPNNLLNDDYDNIHDNNSVSDFDNYDSRSQIEYRDRSNTNYDENDDDDINNDNNDNDDDDDFDNEFSDGLQNLGDTATIHKTVGLLRAHKLAISEMVEIMKVEMEIVQDMEGAEDRDSDRYLDKLEDILDLKSEAILTLRKELKSFNDWRY